MIAIKEHIEVVKCVPIVIPVSGLEILAVTVESNVTDQCAIVLLYRKPGQSESRVVWRQLFQKFTANDKVLHVGDFNARNMMWNCRNTDVNGDRLMDEMERAGLSVMNDDTVTHIGDVGCHDSNIDLVVTNDIMGSCVGCKQLNDAWGSDHFPSW